jgi:hypothetical protein
VALAKKGSETSEEVVLYTEAADTSEGDWCPEYIIVTRCGFGGMDLRVFLAIPRVLFLVGTVLIRPFSPSSAVAFFVVAVLLCSVVSVPNVVDICIRRRHVSSSGFSSSSKFILFEDVGFCSGACCRDRAYSSAASPSHDEFRRIRSSLAPSFVDCR